MPDPLSGILGLCRRAGKLAMGFDPAVDAIMKANALLILVANNCAQRTLRNIKRLARENGVEIRELPLSIDEIGYAVAKRAGVLAVCDQNFASKIINLLNENEEIHSKQTAIAGEELH